MTALRNIDYLSKVVCVVSRKSTNMIALLIFEVMFVNVACQYQEVVCSSSHAVYEYNF